MAPLALPVTAAILVGGKSRRMGTDKALLEVEGVALARRVADVAAPLCERVLICGSREDLGGLGYEVIPDLNEGAGPLAGLQAALVAAETDWVLLLACDLPGFDSGLLEALLDRLGEAEATGADAIAARSERGPEPLIALYHRRVAGEVSDRLERGERAAHRLLQSLTVLWQEVGDDRSVANLNSPEDLEQWLKAES